MTGLPKKIVLRAIQASGLNRMALQSRHNDLLALGYHGILSRPAEHPFRYHHTAAEFRSHLEWLGKHTTPLALDDLPAWNGGAKTYSKPPILITFDDGYRNNYTVAAPILKELGMPAVFFLSTSMIGSDNVLWPDEVFLRVQHWRGPGFLHPNGQPMFLAEDPAARTFAAYQVVEACKVVSESERLAYIDSLRRNSPGLEVMADREAQEFMSWEEARALVEMGFDVGSHTVTHPILSQIAAEQLTRELFESRSTIQAKTGSPCRALAYPNGRPENLSGEVLRTAEDAGYEFGFVISDQRGRPGSSLLTIDRVSPPGHSDLSTFALWVGGAREWAHRKKSPAPVYPLPAVARPELTRSAASR
jgi:peptidoglycan/xylan/chitin deacetylase (PgdA/CDA1 family)